MSWVLGFLDVTCSSCIMTLIGQLMLNHLTHQILLNSLLYLVLTLKQAFSTVHFNSTRWVSVGSLLDTFGSFHLINLNILIRQPLPTSFCIYFQMVGLFHLLWMQIGVVIGCIEATQRLLRLLLMEDIEMGTVWCLDSNDQTLFISSPTATFSAFIPDWQVLQVFIGYVGKLSMLWVREDLLFLLLKLANQNIKIFLNFAQRLLVIENF